ncbi:MAG: peptide chain release factor N(5)-glutamine methyltransferase [Treponema sp.]|jgi:release factor glutamine methyltransferase|nr:peptide chain release factor N(5)-glutamine methyltransferase [Treponema sp.]
MVRTNLGAALSEGSALLKNGGVETPALDSSLLLAFAAGLTRERLYAHTDRPLALNKKAVFDGLIRRRLAGESVAVLVGRKEFCGLDFIVTADVLVPRPDTETLVEAALGILSAAGMKGKPALDLCTGSGAVAIAVKHARPDLDMSASDISPAALSVARENARRLVGGGVTFYEGDLFDALPRASAGFSGPSLRDRTFALITANPPYLPAAELAGLSREVRREPALALDGGADGLDLIRRVTREAPARLESGGVLLMEADGSQMAALRGLMAERGLTEISVRADLGGRPRVICGKKP